MNYIDLELDIGFSNCSDSTVVDLFDGNGHVVQTQGVQSGSATLKHSMVFPNHLRLIISNLGSCAGASIKLERLVVGRMPINQSILPKICAFRRLADDEADNTDQWNSDGTITIDFPYDNCIRYLLSIGNKFQFS